MYRVTLSMLILITVTLACGPRTPGPDDPDNPVIADVRTESVRMDAFEFFIQRHYPELGDLRDDAIYSHALDRFLDSVVVAQMQPVRDEEIDQFLNQHLGGVYPQATAKEQELWRGEVRRRLAMSGFLKRDVLDRVKVSDDTVAHWYQTNQEEYKLEPTYRIRFVHTTDKTEAEKLRAALKASEEPFVTVAAEFAQSEGYRAAVPLKAEELPDPFLTQVRRMKPGQYSRIIPIKAGELEYYYVLYLESVIEEQQAPVEDIFFHIRKKLQRQRANALFDEKVRHFRARTPIKVYFSRLPFTYLEPAEREEV